MTTLLLFVITICSFLFYGVVGEDKTWLLAPAFMMSYGLISIALLKRAVVGGGDDPASSRLPSSGIQVSSFKFPVSAYLWLLFLIYGIAMIPLAAVPFESKLELLLIGSVVGAYVVWGGELTTFKDNRVVLGALIFTVMLTALYGLIVHFKCPDRVLWAERYASYDGRLMSTYICPNHFAHLMQMLLPFCLALLFIPQAGLYLKVLSAYSMLAFLPPLFLTESRAGWLGSIAAVGVALSLMALRRSKKLFVLIVILIPLGSFLILLAGWQYSETFQRRAKPVVEFLQQQSDEGVGSEAKDFRPQTWMDTIDMIKEAPLFGHGPGNYRYTYPEYRKRCKAMRIVTGHPHNEYLELIADYGLVGFGLFALAWMYGLVWVLIRSLKAEETRHAYLGFAFLGAAAGTMVHSFFDFEMQVYPNALVFALLAALAAGPLRAAGGRRSKGRKVDGPSARDSFNRERTQGTQRRDGNKTSNTEGQTPDVNPATALERLRASCASLWLSRCFSWLLAVGYLLTAVLCIQIMLSGYLRALADKAAVSARQSPDAMQRAQKFYTLAVRIDSQNWRAYRGMAMLDHSERYYLLDQNEKVRLAEEERSWFEKAYAHNPKDPETISTLGKTLIFLGRQQELAAKRLEETQRQDSGTTDQAPASVAPDNLSKINSERSERFTTTNQILSTKHQEPGTKDQEPGTKDQEPGTKDQEPGTKDQGPVTKDQEPVTKDQEPVTKDQGPGTKDQGSGTKDQSPRTKDLQAAGLDLLREACRYRPFNEGYWWSLGVELRKAGFYQEALEAFQRMETIKRTPSSRKNIQWLEKRLAEGQKSEVGGQKPEADGQPRSDLYLKREKTDLNDLLKAMEK